MRTECSTQSNLLTISWCLGHLGQESVRGTSMQWVEAVCKDLGHPLAAHKYEGPTDMVTFVGIELNIQRIVMRLPQDKLEVLREKLEKWTKRKARRTRKLLSLIGHLVHACKVITAGRMFLRRMIDLAASRLYLGSWIRLGLEFQSDLQWWRLFVKHWNFPSTWHTSLRMSRFLPMRQGRGGTEATGRASGSRISGWRIGGMKASQ